MNNKFKLLLFIALIALPAVEIYPQDSLDPFAGLDDATDNIKTNYNRVRNFLWAVAGVIAAYGAVRVFSKYQSQDQDTTKAAALYGFGFVFFVIAGFVVQGTFINN